jgi:hypothetical protein
VGGYKLKTADASIHFLFFWQVNYGTAYAGGDMTGNDLVSPKSKPARNIKGLLDEVELNALLLSIVICFFVTFGIKATQSNKSNAVKNIIVLMGGIILFGLLIATGQFATSRSATFSKLNSKFRTDRSPNPQS